MSEEKEMHSEFDSNMKMVNTLRKIADRIQRWHEDKSGEHLESMLAISAELTTCATMFKETLYARYMYLMLVSQNMQTPWRSR